MKAKIPGGSSKADKATAQQQAADSPYRMLFEHAPVGVLIADAEGRYLDANPGLCRMLGYRRDELVGLHASDTVVQSGFQQIDPALNKITFQPDSIQEWQFRRKDGSVFSAEVSAAKLPDDNLLGIVRDITALKSREREVARLTRLYAALSQINQAIVMNRNRDELFDKICSALIEHGGFLMAWIGWHNPETHQIVPMAECGDDSGYIRSIKVYGDERPEGSGPTGTSFRTGRPYICNDMLNDPATLPWRDEIVRRGFRASAVFPIRENNRVSGTLTVYADHTDFFQQEEIALLEEAAGDVSFALDNLSREEQRRQAETKALNEKLFSDTMIESMPGIMYFFNEQGQFLRWNKNFETVSGYSTAEFARMHPLDFFSSEEKPALELRIAEVFETGESSIEATLVAKDGKTTPYFFTGRRVEFNGMPCLIGMGIDISERKSIEDQINFKNTILKTQQETSLDAILVVGSDDHILSFNQNFVDLWGIPAKIAMEGLDAPLLKYVTDKIVNHEAFVARVKYLYQHRDEKSRDEIFLKDGRVIDRFSAPITDANGKYYGRVWYFRDITESRQALLELQSSELWFRSIFENVNTAIASTDSVGRVVRFNEAFSTMMGYDADALKTMNFADFTHPEDLKIESVYFDEILAGKRNHYRITKRYIANHGRIIWVDLSAAVIRDAEGKVKNFVAVIQDITDRKEAEARIIYLNRVYAVLSGINTLIVRVRDHDELFNEACRIAVDAGGFRMAMLCTTDTGTMKMVPCAQAGKSEELIAAVKVLLSSEHAAHSMVARAISEKRAIVSNDSQNDPQVLLGDKYAESGVRSMAVFPLIVSGVASGVLALYAGEIDFFHQEEINLLNELTEDIAFAIDHIEKQEKLNFLAYYDELTGLANRSLFLERVAQYLRSANSGGHKLALLIIDLERFKNINDSLGRPVGDTLLKHVAQWLVQHLGGENLVARLEADHFAVVMPEIREEGDLSGLFDQTSEAFLGHTFRLNDTHELRIAAKAGIAIYPDDGTDVDVLYRNAEAALKMAKKSGSRYLFHTQKMTETVADKLILENQLRQAIDKHEFVLHYQPKVNLLSGQVTGAEALIRWNKPNSGLVPPGKFIPILEETGLIYEVGRWALRQAIADFLRWRNSGFAAVPIAVNVSPLQLRNPGFVSEIESKIAVDSHAAAGIELEITESMIMENFEQNTANLQAIRNKGVRIAIDDFGTGFSSLGYLSKLPVDTMKIDRSFVIEMTADPRGQALVSTIISLAHALNLKVVAEGVETEEQASLLRLLNCDEMQGYLFSKPLPVGIFEAKYLDRSERS
jgi:PAS domain S-box-containing protein/diguanylate cyclase (GGDEF)-like protein